MLLVTRGSLGVTAPPLELGARVCGLRSMLVSNKDCFGPTRGCVNSLLVHTRSAPYHAVAHY